MFIWIIAVACVAGLHFARAQRGPLPMQVFPGACPDIPADASFDIKKASEGVWYQVYASDEVHWNESLKCIERRYSYTESNPVVPVQKYYIVDRRPIWRDGSLITTNTTGVFLHGLNPKETEESWHHQVDIRVLVNDLNSHLVMWGCLYSEKDNIHYESGGISSRTLPFPEEKFQAITKTLSDAGVGLQFQPVDWSDCRVRCE